MSLTLTSPKPFLKWVGGKRQLLPQLRSSLPSEFGTYYEPFVGAGALLFDLAPKRWVINDTNADLIACYRTISVDIGALIQKLQAMPNDPNFFYGIRQMDRAPDYFGLPELERAARMIYLNKTCFNGLYRVNSAGYFNAAFGKYPNPLICDEWGLVAAHTFLAKGKILLGDYREAIQSAKSGDLIYFDPPYDATYTGYQAGGFDRAQQEALAKVISALTKKGVFVMLSNSRTEFIEGLYRGYHRQVVQAKRSINSNGSGRGPVDEVIITNYAPGTNKILGKKAV